MDTEPMPNFIAILPIVVEISVWTQVVSQLTDFVYLYCG